MTPFRVVAGLCTGLALSACQTAVPSQSAATPATSVPVLAARPPVSPDRLIGLAADDILKLFGAPSLKRRESPAELWQYAAQACVMDLYLYADGDMQRVSYVTLRDPASGRVGGSGCQEQLARLSDR